MSLTDVKAFYQRLSADESLYQRVQNVTSKEECSQIVKAAGYDFTQQEFEEYTAQILENDPSNGELKDVSEKELEAVVGGISSYLQIPFHGPYQCYGLPYPLPFIE
jgi:predicted ribosomally synthesized peptide with nif11-like leader